MLQDHLVFHEARMKTHNTLPASMGRHTVFSSEQKKTCPFKEKKKSVGDDWLQGFLKRNPQVCLRKPEATSINRITAFNKKEVTLFFTNLDKVITKYKFKENRIYNTDETGISTVQKPQEILAKKGLKQTKKIKKTATTPDKEDKANRKTVKQQTTKESYKRKIFAEDDDNQQKVKQRKSRRDETKIYNQLSSNDEDDEITPSCWGNSGHFATDRARCYHPARVPRVGTRKPTQVLRYLSPRSPRPTRPAETISHRNPVQGKRREVMATTSILNPSLAQLETAFLAHYGSKANKVQLCAALWSKRQQKNEPTADFIWKEQLLANYVMPTMEESDLVTLCGTLMKDDIASQSLTKTTLPVLCGKRKKTKQLRLNNSVDELTYATQMSLRSSGHIQAAKLVNEITSTSPARARKYRRAFVKVEKHFG
ncbi:hypothetical protein ILUMI_24939 [Ignelater luminosus]|uniref:Uncharacterized protein n=1 Tax=Ignelater luminosus TaxID=2038154 RepID=A0A8K0G0H9_IGNLU|nr:hypothetical protein ILUMI_24939 [Ignelater luminosus]